MVKNIEPMKKVYKNTLEKRLVLKYSSIGMNEVNSFTCGVFFSKYGVFKGLKVRIRNEFIIDLYFKCATLNSIAVFSK